MNTGVCCCVTTQQHAGGCDLATCKQNTVQSKAPSGGAIVTVIPSLHDLHRHYLGLIPNHQPPVSYRRSSLDLRSLQASSLLQCACSLYMMTDSADLSAFARIAQYRSAHWLFLCDLPEYVIKYSSYPTGGRDSAQGVFEGCFWGIRWRNSGQTEVLPNPPNNF